MESLLYAAGTIQINFTSRRTVESVVFSFIHYIKQHIRYIHMYSNMRSIDYATIVHLP